MEHTYTDLIYHRGQDPALEAQFASAKIFLNVRLGDTHLFWKQGLYRYALPLSRVTGAYRRVEEVRARMCCGTSHFDTQKLMLLLTDGTELPVTVGTHMHSADMMHHQAEALYQALKEAYPQLQYGKPA